MIKTYQMKFKNHWAVFNHIIASSILSFPIAMIIGNSQNWPNDAYVYLVIYWILYLTLIIVLHIQYYSNNKHFQLTINSFHKLIIFENIDESKTINFEEIDKIEVFMVPSMYRGSTYQMMSWEPYHYTVIYTQEDKIIITCLVMKDIMKELDYFGLEYTKVMRLFPYIKTPK